MAKFDCHNPKHVIIAVTSVLTVLLLIAILVLGLVLFLRKDSKRSKHEEEDRKARNAEGDVNLPWRQLALNLHNGYRKLHHVGPLKQSKELNKLAQSCAEYYSENRIADHSCPRKSFNGQIAGENIFLKRAAKPSQIVGDEKFAKAASEMWYSEKHAYDFQSGLAHPSNLKGVGHFTQVVWKATQQVGFGLERNKDLQLYFVALYDPIGNADNMFGENVLPI